jgi:hypothetical protein
MNTQFYKEFKEISHNIIRQMGDWRLKDYNTFESMFRCNMEIQYPFTPETKKVLIALYEAFKAN